MSLIGILCGVPGRACGPGGPHFSAAIMVDAAVSWHGGARDGPDTWAAVAVLGASPGDLRGTYWRGKGLRVHPRGCELGEADAS